MQSLEDLKIFKSAEEISDKIYQKTAKFNDLVDFIIKKI